MGLNNPKTRLLGFSVFHCQRRLIVRVSSDDLKHRQYLLAHARLDKQLLISSYHKVHFGQQRKVKSISL